MPETHSPLEHGSHPVEPAPPLGSWRRMYALVIGTDIAIIVLLTLFTRFFD